MPNILILSQVGKSFFVLFITVTSLNIHVHFDYGTVLIIEEVKEDLCVMYDDKAKHMQLQVFKPKLNEDLQDIIQ